MLSYFSITGELAEKITLTLIILVVSIIARTFAGVFIKIITTKLQKEKNKVGESLEKRISTLTSLINSTANLAIYGIAFLMIMSQWGMNIAPILTGAGILGLAVGFGAQTLVTDVVKGFFILLENSYLVGDTVVIAGITGKVMQINLRTTILMDDEGNVHTIPNSNIGPIKRLVQKKDNAN